jgi:hypothetical protein
MEFALTRTGALAMRYVVFCSLSLLVGQLALAQSAPAPRIGTCPTGTSTQGSSCVPRGGTQVYYNGGSPCPLGWVSSKGYCVK